jgi:hypothetical protein
LAAAPAATLEKQSNACSNVTTAGSRQPTANQQAHQAQQKQQQLLVMMPQRLAQLVLLDA